MPTPFRCDSCQQEKPHEEINFAYKDRAKKRFSKTCRCCERENRNARYSNEKKSTKLKNGASSTDADFDIVLNVEYSGGLSQGMKTLLDIIAADFIREHRQKTKRILEGSKDCERA